MDIAQTKQVTRRVNGSLPTDLSKIEGDRIIKDPSVTGELAHFWFRVRNVAREPASKFAVYIDGDTMKNISGEGILFLSHHGDDELDALVKKYTDDAWERAEVLEVLEISGIFTCREELVSVIDDQGYIPAAFDELIAFAWQHDHFFTTRGHCFINVLEPTTGAGIPHVWHDNSPRGGYPQLNLSFDDVEDFLLQASFSSIHVLVKKKGHEALPLDDCNKAVIQLTEELIAFDGVKVEVRKLLEKYHKVQMDYLTQSVKMVRLINAIMDLPFVGYYFWRMAERVYARPISDDPKELNKEIVESAPRIKFLRQLAKEIREAQDEIAGMFTGLFKSK